MKYTKQCKNVYLLGHLCRRISWCTCCLRTISFTPSVQQTPQWNINSCFKTQKQKENIRDPMYPPTIKTTDPTRNFTTPSFLKNGRLTQLRFSFCTTPKPPHKPLVPSHGRVSAPSAHDAVPSHCASQPPAPGPQEDRPSWETLWLSKRFSFCELLGGEHMEN